MEPGRVREQLNRILSSPTFVDAERAIAFLRFIVELALNGRAEEIKESVIAVEVLGRSASFDSRTDPIVRVEAGRLRDRLHEYYECHGSVDDVLISVPKGGYVPAFSERAPAMSSSGDVLRLSVLSPDGTDLDSFAISPDARKVAFAAYSGGQMVLWVRDLDCVDAKPLPGTEDASQPFWSPDSQRIAFFTPFKLKIVHATGGPCRDLADVVLGRGGAWNRDVIVFCPRPVGPLYRIAATGGTPQPITSLDTSRREVSHAFPHFLTDGRNYVFFAASAVPGESTIRTGSLDSNVSKPLVAAETSAIYARVLPGRTDCLLFVHNDSLMAQTLDLHALELRGRPEVIAPTVRYRKWGQAGMSISESGILLYRTGLNQSHQFTWLNRDGVPVGALGARNSFACSPHYSFSLSPDERRIAIHRHDDPDTPLPAIWVMDLFRGGVLWRFTEPAEAQPEFSPVWSSRSSEILYSSGDDRGMRILRRKLNRGNPVCLVETKGPKFPTDWSEDEGYLAYNSQEPDYRYQHTWVAETYGGNQPYPFLNHDHHDGSARFAPSSDGNAPAWIAYTSNETGRHEIYVRSFPDGRDKWQISTQGGFLPQWRRDGRELFYLAPDGDLMAVRVNPEPLEFEVPHKLWNTGLNLHPHSIWMNQYGVADDGQRFLINCRIEKSPAAITAAIPR